MDFDEVIDRHGTHSMKWDMMEARYGVPADTGIPMWVADMDFRAAPPIRAELEAMCAHGIYGYYGDDASYLAAIGWWMRTRHGWEVEPDWIFTTHGLVNGTALCVDTYTAPGDGVVLFTPVYHAFARVIQAAGREVVECEMANDGGRYVLDFEAWDRQMTGREKMLVLSSPHNPGGRVWTREELEGIRDFCIRHDLVLVSDEIHHDLVFPGVKHTPFALIEGVEDRLIMMTSTTKTFNIAGIHVGNVIIPDPGLRKAFAARMAALGISGNAFGFRLAEAAYSPAGAAWVDDLVGYLDGNRRLFDDAVNAIPGLASMPLESTYLAWVDFSGTGMSADEVTRRVQQEAKIAVNHGPTFGRGGETFLRFNFATPRSLVKDAVARLGEAFSDLQ
ncbi:MalY/PatB family protein [Sinisalibacter lacisalsi]|uniref:cysteine-S-conjugate beta-lyase n=1 Tax=Sinisalibacter lacisalsi TaxID=1526570 RepID=A0ABQ1QP99_9RHOB|nr:MalY/PatB family protein [Sinisalibacter lacisalsi]GGD36856.1 aminotransferase [Sinisalibacter lacisalsi]